MADNINVTQGSGTIIATDDIGGVQYQRVKLSQGADGSATDVSSAAPLQVTLANTGANTTAVKVDGSAVTQPVSGTVTASAQPGVDIGDVTINNASGASAVNIQDGGNSITVDGTFWQATQPVSLASVPSHAVTNAGTFAVQAAGDIANDAADSGSPQKIGGVATVTEQTAVSASGDRVNASFTSTGKQIVAPFSSPEYFVSGAITTAMTATTSTSLVAAPGAGLRNYITTIIVSNSHATVGTDVIIQDGSGGTTLMTIPAAALYGGAVINLPVPLRQPTTNTALFCANVTTGASTKVSAVGYKGI